MAGIVPVELGDRSYTIDIDCGSLERCGALCRALSLGPRCLLVSDSHVAPIYADQCEARLVDAGFSVRRVVVPFGETSKSQKILFQLYDAALAHGMNRNAFMVALGGGVVGDLTGYAAATFMRGIPFVQIPTSLLAMVDSSVGGKTGINLPQGKNLIGAFHQPTAVLIDLKTLDTLPDREYFSGLAEVVKYGVIIDALFFDTLKQQADKLIRRDPVLLQEVVTRCCELKAEVVRKDELEGGLRAILNYGHTLGHALENRSGYGVLLHGEAISIGMVYAARLSREILNLSQHDVGQITGLLAKLNLPVALPDFPWDDILRAMQKDKKNRDASISFVLAREIGSVEWGCHPNESQLIKATVCE